MSDKTEVATQAIVSDESGLMVKSDEPATAQQVDAYVQITSIAEAANLLNLEDNYNVLQLLTSFEESIHKAIADKKTRMLKPLTDAKNILLRHEVELQVAKEGKFTFTDIIPFDTACISCRGTGEIYKFFREPVTESCTKCENGYVLIKCRACQGTTKYGKKNANLHVNIVECTRCEKDAEGKPTGKEKVKCRDCRGTGKYRKLAIAPKIKSTTHCRDCKGRGFTLPEPEHKPKSKTPRTEELSNPVISEDIGNKLKSATVTE